MSEVIAQELAVVLAAHQIELPPKQQVRLARYCALLWDWNTKLNLTRHTDCEKFVSRDIVDTLAFSQFLGEKEHVLDVGTGGGVPGVILTILRRDLKVTLCDSTGKKARVVADMVEKLGLPVPVLAERAEAVVARRRFNTLLVRAVAPLAQLLTWFQPKWDRFDRLLVLKGPAWVEERGEARHRGLMHGLALRKLHSYPLPSTHSESVLLQICPEDRMLDDKSCRIRPLR